MQFNCFKKFFSNNRARMWKSKCQARRWWYESARNSFCNLLPTQVLTRLTRAEQEKNQAQWQFRSQSVRVSDSLTHMDMPPVNRKEKGQEASWLQDAQCSGSKHPALGLGWRLSLHQHQQMTPTLVTSGPQGKQNQTWTSLAGSCAQSSCLLTRFSSRLRADLELENFCGYWPLSKAYWKRAPHLVFFCFISYYMQYREELVEFISSATSEILYIWNDCFTLNPSSGF